MADNLNFQELASKFVEQETSAEMVKLRQLIMLRIAMEGEVNATRIPAPLNITEVGGYYNLLRKQNENTMMRQLVSSALGLPSTYAPDATEEIIKTLLNEIMKKSK